MILGAVLLCLAGWGATFGLAWGNFWVKIGLTVSLITAYACYWERPRFTLSMTSAGLGLLSAAVLYGVFYLGKILAPYVVPEAAAQVEGIYGLGQGNSPVLVFLLLLLITGPGEEIFWRGFLQNNLMKKWGPLKGFMAATALYGGVHVFSGNIMLIGAAFVAGSFWGLIYLWRRDLTLLIVSHSLWSAFIFAVLPIK